MSSELQADSFLISHLGSPIEADICSQIRLICLLAEQIDFSTFCSIILDLCCVAPLIGPSCVIFSPTLIISYQILGEGCSSPILLNCSLAVSFNVSFSSCLPKCKDSLGTFFKPFSLCPSNYFLQELVDCHLQYISLVYTSSPDLAAAISISLSRALI